MSIYEYQMKTHSREDISKEFDNLNLCIIHGRRPVVLKIVVGRRKDIVYCMMCDSEDCRRITDSQKTVESIWNKFNPHGIENHSI